MRIQGAEFKKVGKKKGVLQCVAVGVLHVYYSAFAVCAATRPQGAVFSKWIKSQISKVSSRLYVLYTMTKELMNF